MTAQDLFNSTIGQLDHVLSLLVLHAKKGDLDEANRQTLKHHAEDMIAAGQCILGKLGDAQEGLPQPAPAVEVPPKREPKVGDRVRVRQRSRGYAYDLPRAAVGKIGEMDLEDKGAPYYVECPNGCAGWARKVEVID